MHLITDNIQRLIALCRKQNITGYPESSKRSPSASPKEFNPKKANESSKRVLQNLNFG